MQASDQFKVLGDSRALRVLEFISLRNAVSQEKISGDTGFDAVAVSEIVSELERVGFVRCEGDVCRISRAKVASVLAALNHLLDPARFDTRTVTGSLRVTERAAPHELIGL